VVVSYWSGRHVKKLHRLLDQMLKYEAGSPFHVVVVCNGGEQHPLSLPSRFAVLNPRVLARENTHYNLGAWDFGWRNAPGYEYYLFLQDDCHLKLADWVYEFEHRMDRDPGVGLLGELERSSNMSWEFLASYNGMSVDPATGKEAKSIDLFLSTLEKHGIDSGSLGTHLPSLVLFTSRRILEEIGGFPFFGPSYQEAVWTEVATSRLIVAKGYRISKVTDFPFCFIGHDEWKLSGSDRRTGIRRTLHDALEGAKRWLKAVLRMKQKSRRSA